VKRDSIRDSPRDTDDTANDTRLVLSREAMLGGNECSESDNEDADEQEEEAEHATSSDSDDIVFLSKTPAQFVPRRNRASVQANGRLPITKRSADAEHDVTSEIAHRDNCDIHKTMAPAGKASTSRYDGCDSHPDELHDDVNITKPNTVEEAYVRLGRKCILHIGKFGYTDRVISILCTSEEELYQGPNSTCRYIIHQLVGEASSTAYREQKSGYRVHRLSLLELLRKFDLRYQGDLPCTVRLTYQILVSLTETIFRERVVKDYRAK
jgi:hypothetical protein